MRRELLLMRLSPSNMRTEGRIWNAGRDRTYCPACPRGTRTVTVRPFVRTWVGRSSPNRRYIAGSCSQRRDNVRTASKRSQRSYVALHCTARNACTARETARPLPCCMHGCSWHLAVCMAGLHEIASSTLFRTVGHGLCTGL